MDAVTFEVVRNKLAQIAEEMALTLINVSGSVVVTEVGDFGVGVFNPEGDLVAIAPYVIGHVAAMEICVKNIIADCSEDPGIEDGDMFLLNDPYKGALHQSDIVILAPLFWEERLVAWVGCLAHQADIGAINPGGFHPGVTNVYQEGLRIPGLKIMERGKLRSDIWRSIFNMVRVPQMALDLRGQIAANNVAKDRLRLLIEKYGLGVVQECMNMVISSSAGQMEDRLAEFPDGEYTASDWFDNDGLTDDVFELRLTMKKVGRRLIMDFTGTSPSAPGSINCGIAGSTAGVATSLFTAMAWDIPWNAGLLRPVEIVLPEGSLVNPKPPSCVGRASVTTMWLVRNVVTRCLSQMFAESPKYADRAMAVWQGSMVVPVLSGIGPDNKPWGVLLMDVSIAGGCGAVATRDGLSGTGDANSPSMRVPNVETHESSYPLLYMFRREATDTGGAGKYRGGLGLEMMMIPYGGEIVLTVAGHGTRCPSSAGVFGGLPGQAMVVAVSKDCNAVRAIEEGCAPQDFWAMQGDVLKSSRIPLLSLGPSDAMYFRITGGGGYGDELERDPAAVQQDLLNGAVSKEVAEKLYCVAFRADGTVDRVRTDEMRRQAREARIGTKIARESAIREGATKDAAIRGHFTLQKDKLTCLCGCEYALDGWKEHTIVREHSDDVAATAVVPEEGRQDFVYQGYFCRDCGIRLWGEVARRTQ